MIEDLLAGLVRFNLSIALPLLAVFALRKPARKAFGARAAYLLWIAPVLAGVAVLVPPAGQVAPLTAPAIEVAAIAAGGAVAAGVNAAPGLPGVLFNAWVMGVAAALALLAGRQARYLRGLGRLEPVAPRTFRAEQAGFGPAVVGAFRPRIVTPADFETRFAAEERKMILAHEGAHLARGDALINFLACLALCVCWFNPLVHIAVRLMRLDQELACDATVLGCFPGARKLYAEVLLKTQLDAQPLPIGCQWPAAAAHPLKARIVMLKAPLPARGRSAAGFCAVALLSLAAAATAWAAQPGKPQPAPAASQGLIAEDDRPCTAEETRLYNCKDGPDAKWLRRPSVEQVRAVYPADALKAGVSGRAILNCLVNPADGTLNDCIAIREVQPGLRKPPGYDFERPALRLAPFYQVDVASLPRNGKGALPQMRIIVAFQAAPVASGAAKPASARIGAPDWIERPKPEDVAWAYPAAAKAQKLEGGATLACRIDGEGALGQCEVVKETPEGAGFGEAALALAPTFRMTPVDKSGQKTAGADVRIPILFRLPS